MEKNIDRCECGNAATDTLENGSPACEYCATHEGHVAPDSISTGHAHFSGAYVARCGLCNYVCASWDCPCELAHDCEKTFAAEIVGAL